MKVKLDLPQLTTGVYMLPFALNV